MGQVSHEVQRSGHFWVISCLLEMLLAVQATGWHLSLTSARMAGCFLGRACKQMFDGWLARQALLVKFGQVSLAFDLAGCSTPLVRELLATLLGARAKYSLNHNWGATFWKFERGRCWLFSQASEQRTVRSIAWAFGRGSCWLLSWALSTKHDQGMSCWLLDSGGANKVVFLLGRARGRTPTGCWSFPASKQARRLNVFDIENENG